MLIFLFSSIQLGYKNLMLNNILVNNPLFNSLTKDPNNDSSSDFCFNLTIDYYSFLFGYVQSEPLL